MEFSPIIIPGIKEALIPVLTLSPMKTPSFFRPVETDSPFILILISLLSNLRFATLVPAPKLQFFPITESPIYERWPIVVFSRIKLLLISTPFPIRTPFPKYVLDRRKQFGPTVTFSSMMTGP